MLDVTKALKLLQDMPRLIETSGGDSGAWNAGTDVLVRFRGPYSSTARTGIRAINPSDASYS